MDLGVVREVLSVWWCVGLRLFDKRAYMGFYGVLDSESV